MTLKQHFAIVRALLAVKGCRMVSNGHAYHIAYRDRRLSVRGACKLYMNGKLDECIDDLWKAPDFCHFYAMHDTPFERELRDAEYSGRWLEGRTALIRAVYDNLYHRQ